MTREVSLLELRAKDVMTRDLVVIPDDMTVQEAGRRLCRLEVSGAPVVNCHGVVVGVLSSSDFVRLASMGEKVTTAPCDCVYSDWQLVDVDKLPTESVQRCMTPDPVTAGPNVAVTELARMMVDAHIHRVVIVDDDGAPKGIVTTSDILGAVARMDADNRHSPVPA